MKRIFISLLGILYAILGFFNLINLPSPLVPYTILIDEDTFHVILQFLSNSYAFIFMINFVLPIVVSILLLRLKIMKSIYIGTFYSCFYLFEVVSYLIFNYTIATLPDFMFNLPLYIGIITINITSLGFLYYIVKKSFQEEKSLIKEYVIKYSNKYTELEVKDIVEKCKEAPSVVIRTLKSMLKNNEVSGYYFKKTKKVAFNLQDVGDKLDEILTLYSQPNEKKA